MKSTDIKNYKISISQTHNLEVLGSSPSWSTKRIKHLQRPVRAWFSFYRPPLILSIPAVHRQKPCCTVCQRPLLPVSGNAHIGHVAAERRYNSEKQWLETLCQFTWQPVNTPASAVSMAMSACMARPQGLRLGLPEGVEESRGEVLRCVMVLCWF